jgi:hypothetical protein
VETKLDQRHAKLDPRRFIDITTFEGFLSIIEWDDGTDSEDFSITKCPIFIWRTLVNMVKKHRLFRNLSSVTRLVTAAGLEVIRQLPIKEIYDKSEDDYFKDDDALDLVSMERDQDWNLSAENRIGRPLQHCYMYSDVKDQIENMAMAIGFTASKLVILCLCAGLSRVKNHKWITKKRRQRARKEIASFAEYTERRYKEIKPDAIFDSQEWLQSWF